MMGAVLVKKNLSLEPRYKEGLQLAEGLLLLIIHFTTALTIILYIFEFK